MQPAIKYYRRAMLTSLAIALLCNIAYMVLDSIFSTYKSEWLTTESLFPVLMFMALVNALIFAVLSLPVLLNNYTAVRNNAVLSTTAWLLLPAIWMTFIFIATGSDLYNYNDGLDSPGIFPILNTLPYLVVLIITYLQFRKAIRRTRI